MEKLSDGRPPEENDIVIVDGKVERWPVGGPEWHPGPKPPWTPPPKVKRYRAGARRADRMSLDKQTKLDAINAKERERLGFKGGFRTGATRGRQFGGF